MKYQRCIPLLTLLSVIIFLSACAATQHFRNASEVQWTPVTKGQADAVKIFIDEKSIRHMSDTVVRLRLRYRYSSPNPFDSGYVDELVVYNEYDCNNKETYNILWSEAHFIDGVTKADSSKRQGYILPDDAVFRFLCAHSGV